MVSSWFRSGSSADTGSSSLKEVLPSLHPPKHQHQDSGRFSQLLLEHGEQYLQDWAVWAYSSPVEATKSSSPRRSEAIQWAQQSPQSSSHRSSLRHSKASIHPIVDMETYPTCHMKHWEGRLHLCTRSIVLEPTDPSRGIVRCAFAKIEGSLYPSESGFECMSLEFFAKRHIVMKKNNLIGPSEAVHVPTKFLMTFLHSSPTACVELLQKLMPLAAKRTSLVAPELSLLLRPLDRPFSPDNLVDLREQVTVSTRCVIVTPLQESTGVMAVTSDRVYFQPSSGVALATERKATHWMQSQILATARRYKGLRDSALEVYWKDNTSTLFAFDRRHDRETVLRYLSAAVCVTDRSFVIQAHSEWNKGHITNMEYLLALNAAAGRSFHDLSRYPVFPWVIADYSSAKLDLSKPATFRDLTKPVGALNQQRLEYFCQRLQNMHDMEAAFLYGTHYSAPGYVLYYLVRSMPEHMLCLQNGKFDSADRMFYSVAACYDNVLKNHADVKELLPQFYSEDFDFLINTKGLQLGATQMGERVNDVVLPPWARSARDFLRKNRKALESDYCTKQLPAWINLIFGVTSRGEPAMEAFNVFHPMAYLGPTDVAAMKSDEERVQAELQATEFGIVPDQLFCQVHPSRHANATEDFVSEDLGRASSKDDGGRETWELLETPPEPIPEAELEQEAMDVWTQSLVTEEEPSPQKKFPLRGTGESMNRQVIQTSSYNSQDSGPTAAQSPKFQSFDSSSPVSSDWNMTVIERKQLHSDAVSGCALLLDGNKSVLATTSLDGGLKVHKVSVGGAAADDEDRKGFPSTFSRFSYSTIISRGQINQASSLSKLSEYRSHSSRDPLASLVLASDGSGGYVAFAGGHDDVVLAYGINSGCAVASLYSHRDAVTGLDLIQRTPFDSECALWLENSTHIMISGSWDATVKVWSATVSGGEAVAINREPLAELFDADSSIACVSAKSIPSGGIVIAAGCADGSFCVWNVHNDGVQVVIHNESARRGSGPCSVVHWVSDAGRLFLFAAFSTGMVASYALNGGTIHRLNAVSVGVSVSSLAYASGALLVGSADGALRLIPVRDGAHFEKPSLWRGVNNKSSPGITSISVLPNPDADTLAQLFCCTGGDDGSVALFELKKSAT